MERADIYNDKTTFVTPDNPPVLSAPRCNLTGLWKLTLDPQTEAAERKETNQRAPEEINVVFDLPSMQQTFLWYHTTTRFPINETFIKAVQKGNFATRPKLTTHLIHKYFLDSNRTIKGHIKGQRQGIQSTKIDSSVTSKESNKVQIKI
jgi:hypothetical protein